MDGRLDLLNRDKFVDYVIDLVRQLSDEQKGCCFSIEGSWGIGKTYILEEIEKRIKEVDKNRFFLFHYNCWKYDYYDEPSVAIISAMLHSISEEKAVFNKDLEGYAEAGYKLVRDKFKEIAGAYIENKIGVNLVSMIDDTKNMKEKNEDEMFQFDHMFRFNQTIEIVRKDLQEIARERTIVLIVDELDRCIPQYAIKVLERLHHMFDGLRNVVVVVAIDRAQLEHSIEDMFGINGEKRCIDVEKYLKKFINFSLALDSGEINNRFIEKYRDYFDKFSANGGTGDLKEINRLCPQLFNGIDIRSQEKVMEKAGIIHSLICKEPVDLSICVFEILYLILELWQFGNKKNLVLLNDVHYPGLEKEVGKERIELLKELEMRATEINQNIKSAVPNLYGKVFWYFAKLFNGEKMPYEDGNMYSCQMANCLEIARKYHEHCKFIR